LSGGALSIPWLGEFCKFRPPAPKSACSFGRSEVAGFYKTAAVRVGGSDVLAFEPAVS